MMADPEIWGRRSRVGRRLQGQLPTGVKAETGNSKFDGILSDLANEMKGLGFFGTVQFETVVQSSSFSLCF